MLTKRARIATRRTVQYLCAQSTGVGLQAVYIGSQLRAQLLQVLSLFLCQSQGGGGGGGDAWGVCLWAALLCTHSWPAHLHHGQSLLQLAGVL